MTPNMLVFAVFLTLFVALSGVGIHNAVSRLLSLVDGHLELLQGKLDALLAAQAEHNQKIDVLLRKMF